MTGVLLDNRCQAAQGKILFLKNFGVRLRMRASPVYEPMFECRGETGIWGIHQGLQVIY